MKKIIILLLSIFSLHVHGQHQPLYSQYMFNGLVLNPAFAGSSDVLNLSAIHRNQWTGFEGAPVTSTISGHTPLKNKKINFGLTLLHDKFGINENTRFDLSYAYRLTLAKGSLAFGLRGGINIMRYNMSQAQITTPGDFVFGGQDEVSSTPEAGAGIYYRSEQLYAGASMPTMLSSSGKGPSLITAGYVFFLPDDMKLKHSILLKYIHGSPMEVDFNTNIYYKNMGLGFSYRSNDALVFLLEYRLNDQFSAGYSYDMVISKLGAYNRGSHEIVLRYEFGYGVSSKNPRYF